jgi:uncharacterized NAD-dependent epimerase/dehydratase family protein
MYEIIASGAGAFHDVPVVGIALNTRNLGEVEAKNAIAQIIAETGLPCTDPIRFGAGLLLDTVMQG